MPAVPVKSSFHVSHVSGAELRGREPESKAGAQFVSALVRA
ncbi:hypothetical protein PV416_38445 [Streptomyces ipomoeae]|jgi:hypothetical protein|uniref:Uncharacterized protein n=1 Tax=Streptomyces ipomoeae 91-03 TaxID=698759 RepID=L1L4A6_9ACTN|nr:hypothetical protein [Streptomyces ipomoeae]EKX67433.1 hypothetical protein STRIP9103_00309 [Streptomyces ipomoeae 91-03]MDX2697358.1 hypothetical protein [Streptomyces ipomoeae]MDX2826792.1 hypothetical protein [Streptomyces ipomoeae]MDX2845021.1 hypothetical protein [Streptomyces ipomoeae]MDX2878822.1 hypothetical protein [Streptomyces ipomoeae]